MVDVILIFAPGESARFDDESLAVCFAATNIERVHPGAIACTVPAGMIEVLQRNPRIAYVRRISAYTGSLAS